MRPADQQLPRDIVRAGYDAIGARYHDWSSQSPTRVAQLEPVLARLAPGSTVLDLGCGPGDPVTRLLSENHHALGVDLSGEQLRLARRHAPRALLAQADVLDLSLRPQSLDAVVSFYVLGHLPAAAHGPLFRRVAQWLRPGGVVLTSAPLSAAEGVQQDWLGVPMFFGGIGEAATLVAVREAGLVVESARVVEEDEGEGRVVAFLWVTATKPG